MAMEMPLRTGKANPAAPSPLQTDQHARPFSSEALHLSAVDLVAALLPP